MFSIFQVLDVEEEQASPTTSIELDVIAENNLFFKSLWPSFYINILTLSVVTWTCPFFFFARFYMATGGRSPIFSRTRGRASISVSVLLPILLVITTITIPTSFMMMIITLLARQAARSLCKQWCRPARRNSTPPLQAFSNGVQRQGGNWWLWLEWWWWWWLWQSLWLGKPSFKKSAVFLNIVQKALDPTPLSFEHHAEFALSAGSENLI